MTVQSTTSNEFTIDQLCTIALRKAGLIEVQETPAAVKLAACRQNLQIICHGLQVRGVNARALEFHIVTLASGTFSYSLQTSVMDVTGHGAYIPASEVDVNLASNESLVTLITVEHWHQLSSKSVLGVPTVMCAKKTSSVIDLRFWPVPNEVGHVRIPVARKLADVTDGNATVDLPVAWSEFLVYRLAEEAAHDASLLETATRMGAKAVALLPMLQRSEGSHVPTQVYLDHPTGWENS